MTADRRTAPQQLVVGTPAESGASPGAVVSGPPTVYGSVGARFGAMIVDALVGVAFVIPGCVVIVAGFSVDDVNLASVGILAVLLVMYCRRVGIRGQSWGHQFCGVRVVGARTGGPIGSWRAFGRITMRAIAALPCYLGLIWALFDRKHRGWHDLAVGSVVVPASYPFATAKERSNGTIAVPQSAPQKRQPPPNPRLYTAQELNPTEESAFAPPPPPARVRAVAQLQAPQVLPTAAHVLAPLGSAHLLQPQSSTVARVGSTTEVALQFDDGEMLYLDRVVLIGRAPSTSASDPGALLVAIDDPTMSVSKMHLAIGVNDGRVWVEDRHSTNGVSISTGPGEPFKLTVGHRVNIVAGTRVTFGDRWLKVMSK